MNHGSMQVFMVMSMGDTSPVSNAWAMAKTRLSVGFWNSVIICSWVRVGPRGSNPFTPGSTMRRAFCIDSSHVRPMPITYICEMRERARAERGRE